VWPPCRAAATPDAARKGRPRPGRPSRCLSLSARRQEPGFDRRGEFREDVDLLAAEEEAEDAVNVIHICPEWFAGPQDIGLRRGDRVKVKGVWAEIDDEFVFMAAKVKKGDFFEFKVRVTSDGTPFWTMSKEEQEKHRN